MESIKKSKLLMGVDANNIEVEVQGRVGIAKIFIPEVYQIPFLKTLREKQDRGEPIGIEFDFTLPRQEPFKE
jgi:hypothetical protein